MRNSKRPRATSGGNDEDDSEEVANDDVNNVLDPISPSVLSREEELYDTYRAAKPFPHCIIQNFCKPGFLGELHHIIIIITPNNLILDYLIFISLSHLSHLLLSSLF